MVCYEASARYIKHSNRALIKADRKLLLGGMIADVGGALVGGVEVIELQQETGSRSSKQRTMSCEY